MKRGEAATAQQVGQWDFEINKIEKDYSVLEISERLIHQGKSDFIAPLWADFI